MFLRVMCNVIILPFIHVITNDKKQQKIEKNQIMHEWVYFIKMCSYIQWKRFFFWVGTVFLIQHDGVLKFVLVKGYFIYENINIENTKYKNYLLYNFIISFRQQLFVLFIQVTFPTIYVHYKHKSFHTFYSFCIVAISGVVTQTV